MVRPELNAEACNIIVRLELELAEYKYKEVLWKQRWQRIAFHIRQKGLQIPAVDEPGSGGEEKLEDREINKILRHYDEDIPRSGRV